MPSNLKVDFVYILFVMSNSFLFSLTDSHFAHSRIAKNAMSLLERFDVADQLPVVYFFFYGRIAWRFEPFQVCGDKTQQAFETSLSLGRVDVAFFCLIHAIKYAIFSGANLRSLLKEIDYYLHLLDIYKIELARNYLLTFRETVSLLIDSGQATSIEAKACIGDPDDPGNKLRETVFFYKTVQCYWVGHTERCQHFSEKCVPILGPLGQLNTCMSKFYHGKAADVTLEMDTEANSISPHLIISNLSRQFLGLNSLNILKKKRSTKSKKGVLLALSAMRDAAANSDWNFTNKLLLFEAEQHAISFGKHRQTLALYDASIASARKSGFIHEQGLACEKAGFYCNRVEKKEKALDYFTRARDCYEKWGSSMKVDFIQKEMNGLNGQ